jgi:co-chaperonin GroES (HSP10)
MRTIGKYIAIAKIEEQVKTASGLMLSSRDVGDMRYAKGLAVTVGPEVVGISDGDTVYYDKSRSYVMVVEQEPYIIISERDVVVVV